MIIRTPVLIVLVGCMFLAALVFFPVSTSESQSASLLIENAEARAEPTQTTDPGASPSPIGRPTRLVIPEIHVDSVIERVGLTPDGAMDVPSNTSNAAWYQLGPKPGENGSAVIAGHFDDRKGKPGVFNKIVTLQQNDKIYVTDEQGMTITFVVRSIQTYNSNEDASVVFNAMDGKAHLNLITCEGVWDETKNSYSHRLVVFADKET